MSHSGGGGAGRGRLRADMSGGGEKHRGLQHAGSYENNTGKLRATKAVENFLRRSVKVLYSLNGSVYFYFPIFLPAAVGPQVY